MQHYFQNKAFRYFTESKQAKSKQHAKHRNGRSLRFETFEPRMMLSVNDLSISGHTNAIPTNQTTGFSSVSQTDHSAVIDLAQTHQVATIAIGSGEASAQSPIHYASASGSGNGTQGSPWSLAQANSQLLAGDTLYLTAGNYVGQIRPARSGTPGNPIRIAAAPGLSPEAVHVRGAVAGGSTRKEPVRITTNYVLVEGFTVSFLNGLQVGEDYSDIRISGQHLTVRNMRVVHDATEAEGPLAPGKLGEYVRQARKSGRSQENGFSVGGKFNLIQNNDVKNMFIGMHLATDKANASFNVIRGNTILDSTWDGIHIGTGNGAPLNHLIENNVISGGLVSDGITFNGRNSSNPSDHLGINQVIVRNNAIFNFTENTIDLKATQNIVVEGNYLWGSIGDNDGSGVVNQGGNSLNNDESGGSGLTKGNGTESTHVIMRNNVIIDNNQGTFTERDYKVYNNTILNNRRKFSGPNQPTSPLSATKPGKSGIKAGRTGPNAAIFNNIMGDHGYEIAIRSSQSGAIDGNSYYNTFQTTQFAQFNNNKDWVRHSTLASWQSWLQSKSNFTGNEANSQVVTGGPSALFVNVPSQPTGDPAQFDFRLKANSPAIDSGVFLTKTVGSGSNKTTMTVGDAKLFFDGYGITLGDEIQLAGQTARARITNISGNTLTLSTGLSWSSGQGVSLAYEGSSPDAGAIEFAGPLGPQPPTAVDDSAVTSVNTAVTTPNVLANDSDPNPGDTLVVQSFTQPSHGSAASNGNGTFLYTPSTGFSGDDSFTYVVSDGNGGTDTGTVSITVTPPGVSFSENFTSPSSLGNFTIVSGGTWAVSGGELKVTNPVSGTGLGELVVHKTATPGDFTINVEARLVDAVSTFGDFAVVFNYQDPNNYYYADFTEINNTATHGILKVQGGVVSQIADFSDSFLITEDVDYSVQVVRTGNSIEAYLNGALAVSFEDTSFSGGQIGLGSFNDSVAFDNLVVNNVIDSNGDFDADGDVDGADFLSWQRGFGTTYDAGDLTDWQDNFGTSTQVVAASISAPPLAATAPALLLLLLLLWSSWKILQARLALFWLSIYKR